jgi:hypothetical protein
MNNTDEKIRILNMVQDGRITAEEAAKLLEALEVNEDLRYTNSPKESQTVINKSNGKLRWVRIQVNDTKTGKQQVNLKLPLGLVKVGMKSTMRLSMKEKDSNGILDEINLDEILKEAIEN